MASSKVPHVYVPVPDTILVLVNEVSPSIFIANYRPDQRLLTQSEDEVVFRKQMLRTYGHDITYDLARFLKAFETNSHLVAIHYQGYGDDMQQTVVVDLSAVTRWSSGTARLEFNKPANWEHCPNFWAAFILGIAAVDGADQTLVLDDPDATKFAEIVRTHGVCITLPTQVEARDCM